MSNTAFDSNSNPIFVAASTNTIVATAKLAVSGRIARKVLLIGEFSFEGTFVNGYVVGDIQVDGNTFLNTQINNVSGTTGAIVTVTGIVTVRPGKKRTFDLRAYTNTNNVSVHHRALSVVDLK
jgi:hypothetical protein